MHAGEDITISQLLMLNQHSNKSDPDGLKKLWFEAAEKGHLRCLDVLLEVGIPVNIISITFLPIPNVSALYCTAEGGHLECFQFLLQRGAKLRTQDLIIAATQKNLDCLKFLVKYGRFTAPDFAFAMAAEVAAMKQDVRIFELLLEQVVNCADNSSTFQYFLYGALRTACSTGHTGYVYALLQAGVSIEGNSDLMYIAASRGHLATMAILLEYGASANMANENNNSSPLHGAVSMMTRNESNCRNRLLWRDGDTLGRQCVQFLLNNGADINKNDAKGQPPLILAAFHGHIECIRELIENGCKINMQDRSGNTALHWAVRLSSPELVQMLLDADAEPDLMSDSGSTALHVAITLPASQNEANSLAIVKQLILSGASINTECMFREETEQCTSLVYACKKGHVKVIRVLLQACCNTQMFQRMYHKSCITLAPIITEDILNDLLNPFSLQMLSRCMIRSSLNKHATRLVNFLPLPKSFIGWLKFPEFCDI